MYRDAGGAEFCLWMFGVLLGLVSRMQKNSRIGRIPGTRARRRRMERSRQWLPSGGLEGSHSPIKETEEASASSRWLDTVPGLF